MRWKTTLVLLVLTVGLGTYVSLYDLRQPTLEQQERLSRQILRLPADSVTQLVIELPQGKTTLFREGSVWRLIPQKWRADAAVIDRIVGDLNPLVAESQLPAAADHPLDPKSFGLDPAVGRITLIAQDTPTTLLVGGTTPVGHNRYLQVVGRPEVFVISSRLFTDVNQPLETFRDPQLIQADPSTAEGLALMSPTVSFTLARHGEWGLTQPFRDRGDRTEVSKLMNALWTIRIKRFVNDAPQVEQLAVWGFDHPRAEVSLTHFGDASASITLFFGNPLPDEATLVYVKRSDEPSLYAVATSAVDALLRDPQSLRAPPPAPESRAAPAPSAARR